MPPSRSSTAVIAHLRAHRRAGIPGHQVPMASTIASANPDAIARLPSWLATLTTDGRLARLLGNDDRHELRAVAEDLETLLARVGYHWHSAFRGRADQNRRVVRTSRAAQQPVKHRGRPIGAQNFALRQFGLGLAVIWNEQTCRRPSRYLPKPGSRRSSYVEFVATIAAEVALPFRRSTAGATPDVEHLVRTSIQDFRSARAAPEEYRRRGLIDERLWLDADDGQAQPGTAP